MKKLVRMMEIEHQLCHARGVHLAVSDMVNMSPADAAHAAELVIGEEELSGNGTDSDHGEIEQDSLMIEENDGPDGVTFIVGLQTSGYKRLKPC